MALHEHPFHPNRPGLVRPMPIDPFGRAGPTRGQARGSAYRRTSHGLYVPRHVSDDVVEQRIVEAVPRSPDALVTGWAALRWLGGTWFTGTSASGQRIPVAVTGSKAARHRSGAWVTKEGWLDPDHWVVADGLSVTTAVRSVHFAMRHAPSLAAAVVAVDMAAYDDLVTLAEVAAFTAASGPRTGVAQARAACALGSENSWSPMETRTRLTWVVDAGLPPPLCNQPVFDLAGRHLGTPDLLDPDAGVAVEYDGALHLASHRRRLDRDLQEAFRAVGLEQVVVVAGDVRTEVTVARLRAAYDRGRRSGGAERDWTIDPPPGWTQTTTVAARRALGSSDRTRLLGYRRAG